MIGLRSDGQSANLFLSATRLAVRLGTSVLTYVVPIKTWQEQARVVVGAAPIRAGNGVGPLSEDTSTSIETLAGCKS